MYSSRRKALDIYFRESEISHLSVRPFVELTSSELSADLNKWNSDCYILLPGKCVSANAPISPKCLVCMGFIAF
jgi:hypothetical protein